MKLQTFEGAYRRLVPRALVMLAIAGLVSGCAMLGSSGDEDSQPSPRVLEKKAGALSATSDAPASNAQQRVTRALDMIYGDNATPRALTYYSKFVDLDGDGQNEAVAFVVGPNHCIDGCNLYVLRPTAKRYEVINRIPTSKVPVYALDHRSHGWRDLLVTTDGGSAASDRQLMQYADGGYVPVAHDPAADAARTPLISSLNGSGHALHPKQDSDSDAAQ